MGVILVVVRKCLVNIECDMFVLVVSFVMF